MLLANLLLFDFLGPILTEPFIHFTYIEKKYISDRERKIVLSAFVKHCCILLYDKCKEEYIEYEVVKVILIRVISKKVINIALKSTEMDQLF